MAASNEATLPSSSSAQPAVGRDALLRPSEGSDDDVGQQTSATVRGMGPDAVAEALREVHSRLSPEMTEFLRQRGARKAAEAAAVTGGAGGRLGRKGAATASASATSTRSVPSPSEPSATTGKSPQTEALHVTQRERLGRPSPDPQGVGRKEKEKKVLEAPSVLRPHAGRGAGEDEDEGEEGDDDEERLVADPRIEARLRFTLHAAVVGIQPEGERSNKSQVGAAQRWEGISGED